VRWIVLPSHIYGSLFEKIYLGPYAGFQVGCAEIENRAWLDMGFKQAYCFLAQNLSTVTGHLWISFPKKTQCSDLCCAEEDYSHRNCIHIPVWKKCTKLYSACCNVILLRRRVPDLTRWMQNFALQYTRPHRLETGYVCIDECFLGVQSTPDGRC
jgi:hypothetical protein